MAWTDDPRVVFAEMLERFLLWMTRLAFTRDEVPRFASARNDVPLASFHFSSVSPALEAVLNGFQLPFFFAKSRAAALASSLVTDDCMSFMFGGEKIKCIA